MQVNRRRFYRCYHDRKIAGVSSGLAEYLDIDVTLIRILWIVSIFFGGLGLLLYLIMAIVVPMEPDERYAAAPDATAPGGAVDAGGAEPTPGSAAPEAASTAWHQPAPAAHRHQSGGGRSGGSGLGLTFLGIVLVLGGSLALLDVVVPAWGDGRFWWPTFVLGLGVILIVMATQRRQKQP
jgi:phage shock protein PspC (stress-responsive transcriptional regulator)